VARLVTIQPTIAALGGQVAAATLGSPDEAAAFCRRRAPGLICLSEPSGNLHRRFGLGHGRPAQLAGPGVWLGGLRAALGGHMIGKRAGDPLMMPGLFVIDGGGRIAYAHYAAHIADHAPNEEVIAAVRRLGDVT
jgi:hypothetical protein